MSRYMALGASGAHLKAMLRLMEYCEATEKRGLELDPNKKFNGHPDFQLAILGKSDNDFAKDQDTRRSVSGNNTILCGAPVAQQNKIHKIVAQSVTESELLAAVSNAQYMMHAKQILEPIKFKVELPIIPEMDNKGAVDLVNNFSVGDRTRHIKTR
jgi:hypothetical protein